MATSSSWDKEKLLKWLGILLMLLNALIVFIQTLMSALMSVNVTLAGSGIAAFLASFCVKK